jgi:lysophospholipase L1-like esterase
MASRARRAGYLAVGLPLAFVGVLAVEATLAARREYFETPGYEVEGTLEPAGGGSGEPLAMVMLGDSTVAGLGAEDVEDSLVLQTAQRAAEAAGRPVRARGLGVSGARTADVRDDQIPQIDPATDVIVIVIGSNDATHLTPFWTFDELTASMLDAARRQAPDAAIVLGGIPLFGEARALDEPLRSVVDGYASVLRGVQRRTAQAMPGVTFVNIAVEASPRFVGVPDAMSRDGFHPAAVGYGFWADALGPAVAAAAPATRGG